METNNHPTSSLILSSVMMSLNNTDRLRHKRKTISLIPSTQFYIFVCNGLV